MKTNGLLLLFFVGCDTEKEDVPDTGAVYTESVYLPAECEFDNCEDTDGEETMPCNLAYDAIAEELQGSSVDPDAFYDQLGDLGAESDRAAILERLAEMGVELTAEELELLLDCILKREDWDTGDGDDEG